jgi:hypothetical protein
MMVLNDNKCKKCNYACNAIHFQRNFKSWTSGNKYVDKFIQDAQLSVHKDDEISHVLEWIPYDRFYDIKYIVENNMYKANWIDGCVDKLDDEYHKWKRCNQNMFVTLKNLNNPIDVTLEFMNKVINIFYYLIKF